ncbi:MAG: hypothetical protein K0S71_774 [Clostridia bacterium]|jgi:polyferredoxin|nr:hypothetical protein [Clostridia bacterium]
MTRQKFRNFLLLISFLLFPVIQFYFSPYIIIAGALEGVITGSFIVFSLMFIGGIFVGRIFCGWVAPCGCLQELCCSVNDEPAKGGKLNLTKYLIWFPWLAIIVGAAVQYGGYKSINPFFYIENGISIGHPFTYIIYYGVIILIVIMSLVFGKRATCHYICWMSPFMIMGIKLRKLLHLPGLHISPVADKCTQCGLCTKACPMSLNVKEMVHTHVFDHEECILCGRCIDVCKNKALKFKFGNFKK